MAMAALAIPVLRQRRDNRVRWRTTAWSVDRDRRQATRKGWRLTMLQSVQLSAPGLFSFE